MSRGTPVPGLKAARIRANLTQKELAKKLDIPRDTLANWEQGYRACTVVEKVASGLNVAVEDLKWPVEVPDPHIHGLRGLYAARREARLSQKQLAKKIGVSENAPRRWERGETKATEEQLNKLVGALGVSRKSLLFYREPVTPEPVKEKPKRQSGYCQHCGTKLNMYNKKSVYCLAHYAPDNRKEAS